jgi:hypothetical protein
MDFPLHEICGDYDDLTGDELDAMRASLLKHGLLVPIVIWRGQIVDGRHRARLCDELGLSVLYQDLGNMPEHEMRARVKALNEHRRAKTAPLTIAEKRERAQEAIKATPGKSDRQIARQTGFSHPFVGKERARLERTGEVETVSTRTGADGRTQPAHKPESKPAPKPSAPQHPPPPADTRPAAPRVEEPPPGKVEAQVFRLRQAWDGACQEARDEFMRLVRGGGALH